MQCLNLCAIVSRMRQSDAINLYLRRDNLDRLRDRKDKTGVPISRTVDDALDLFFKRVSKSRTEKGTPEVSQSPS